jgi:hypothetical protein
MNKKHKKQQQFLALCKSPNNGLYLFFFENKCYLINDRPFANKCLVVLCQNNFHQSIHWIFHYLIVLNEDEKKYLEYHYGHSDPPVWYYLLVFCCENKRTITLFKKLCKKLNYIDNINKFIIEYCFPCALKHNNIPILKSMVKLFPHHIDCYPNFHFGENYYNCKNIHHALKTQHVEKQLFLLWITSSNSPNKNCLLHQLPRDISRYIIEQFVD